MLAELDTELLLKVLAFLPGKALGRLECTARAFRPPRPADELQQESPQRPTGAVGDGGAAQREAEAARKGRVALARLAQLDKHEPEPELELSLPAQAAQRAIDRRRDRSHVVKRLSESWPYLLDVLECRLARGRLAAAGGPAPCTLVTTAGGALHSFGAGSRGQLGHEDGSQYEPTPRQVAGVPPQVTCVALRHNHAAAVSGGELWTWGAAGPGALGHPESNAGALAVAVPCRVELPTKAAAVLVAVGQSHTAVLTADGLVYTWGYGRQGALGHGAPPDGGIYGERQPNEDIIYTPKRVQTLADIGRCIEIACGGSTTAAITETGALYMWGTMPGTLDGGDRTVLSPERVDLDFQHLGAVASQPFAYERPVSVRTVACGRCHFAAVGAWRRRCVACRSDDGKIAGRRRTCSGCETVSSVWTWGHGGDGALGQGHGVEDLSALTPSIVAGGYRGGTFPTDVISVSCGENHTSCVTASGDLYCCKPQAILSTT